MTRRAIIIKYLIDDMLLALHTWLARLARKREQQRLTWPIGTPFWHHPTEEKE